VAEGDEIAAGREAWRRPCSRERKDFDDWLVFGRARLVGRAQALRIAGTSRPFGKRYTRAMRQWLDENGVGGLTEPERHSCTRLIENSPAIEQWRAGLDENVAAPGTWAIATPIAPAVA
jgi:hypothetical protein